MARTDVFRRQHAEIAEVAEDITAALDAKELASGAEIMSGLLSVLGGKLTIHLAMEDKGLYPRLLRHPHPKVRDLAKRFMSEMGGIQAAFGEYLARWRDPALIQKMPDEFIKETRTLLAALSARVSREDNDLYPIVDQEG
jgi:hypothetical protein